MGHQIDHFVQDCCIPVALPVEYSIENLHSQGIGDNEVLNEAIEKMA